MYQYQRAATCRSRCARRSHARQSAQDWRFASRGALPHTTHSPASRLRRRVRRVDSRDRFKHGSQAARPGSAGAPQCGHKPCALRSNLSLRAPSLYLTRHGRHCLRRGDGAPQLRHRPSACRSRSRFLWLSVLRLWHEAHRPPPTTRALQFRHKRLRFRSARRSACHFRRRSRQTRQSVLSAQANLVQSTQRRSRFRRCFSSRMRRRFFVAHGGQREACGLGPRQSMHKPACRSVR